jgi:WD40 repeat protein
MLAFPGRQRGHIQLVDLADAKRAPSLIVAHAGTLACLSMSMDGSKVASASEKGTLIRVFDTETGKLLNELRRGSERAEIHRCAFRSAIVGFAFARMNLLDGTTQSLNAHAFSGSDYQHSDQCRGNQAVCQQ